MADLPSVEGYVDFVENSSSTPKRSPPVMNLDDVHLETCLYCNESFTSKTLLRWHINKRHKQGNM